MMAQNHQKKNQDDTRKTPQEKLIRILQENKVRFKKDKQGNPVKPDEAIVLFSDKLPDNRLEKIHDFVFNRSLKKHKGKAGYESIGERIEIWTIPRLNDRTISRIAAAFPRAIDKIYLNPFGAMNPHHQTIPPDGDGDDDNGGGGSNTDSYFYLRLKLTPPSSHIKVKTSRGKQIKIAVIDSGIDLKYFDKTFRNYYPNLTYSGGYPWSRTDSFHYLWNDKDNTLKTLNFIAPGRLPWDDNGHGTAISKIIKDVMKAHAPQTKYKIIPIKVVAAGGYLDQATAIQGVAKAIELGAHIINCSWSFPVLGNEQQADALYRLVKRNPKICFVCSAGNDGLNLDKHHIYPACHNLPNLIPVIANSLFSFHHEHLTDLGVASYSNYSRRRSLLSGPGRDYPLMIPSYGAEALLQNGKSLPAYVLGYGTSFSAAFISGYVGSGIKNDISTFDGSKVFEDLTEHDGMDHYLYEDDKKGRIPFYGIPHHDEDHH